jgi:hypothetical protein
MILLRTNFVEDVVEWTITQRGPLAAALPKADASPVVPKTASVPLPHIKGSPDADVRDV